MIISIDTEKASDRNQQQFMKKKKKNPPESRHRENLRQHNKDHI